MAGLIALGRGISGDAKLGLEQAAAREQQRNLANQQLAQARQQQTLSNVGAGAGMGFMAGGPMGAAIGAGVGLLVSGFL